MERGRGRSNCARTGKKKVGAGAERVLGAARRAASVSVASGAIAGVQRKKLNHDRGR